MSRGAGAAWYDDGAARIVRLPLSLREGRVSQTILSERPASEIPRSAASPIPMNLRELSRAGEGRTSLPPSPIPIASAPAVSAEAAPILQRNRWEAGYKLVGGEPVPAGNEK